MVAFLLALLGSASLSFAHTPSLLAVDPEPEMRWVEIAARDKHERSRIANYGVSIEAVRTDSVWGFATRTALKQLSADGFRVLHDGAFELGRGGHGDRKDFPQSDARYHNYAEMEAEMRAIVALRPELVQLRSIGKSTEGRELWALHFNSNATDRDRGTSQKPGIVYLGAHHAREHLSVELPLLYARYLAENAKEPTLARLLDTRDVWIIPMVNPDGAEYDIASGSYRMWRKNRRDNGNGTFGVDLNRNYDSLWGQGGSSSSTSSDVYMGPSPFSEPETQAVKRFIDDRPNFKMLLSVHTYSELVLYPWGGKNDPVANEKDRATFIKMAKTMASWNGYKPEQSSDLYIATGDTCDWAYEEHGIFAFTFELSPSSILGGGFYPGEKMIDKAFNANLKPLLYMLDLTDDPHRAVAGTSTGFLKNYVEPRLDPATFWDRASLPKL